MKAASAMPLLALLLAFAPAEGARANPLGKVMELLDSLTAKITKEGETEEKAFREFTDWCKDAAANTGFEIKTATSKKDQLGADIEKLKSDAMAAESKVEELAGSIASSEADLKAANTIRSSEAANFQKDEAELAEAIDTLGRAVTIIEREMAKNPAAFAQVDVSSVSGLVKALSTVVDAAGFTSADTKRLTALVQSKEKDEADTELFGAPAADAYKSHSGGILDVLEDLKEKAEEQLSSLRKAETNARHNYEMLKQSLDDQTTADTKDMTDEKASLAAAKEGKATAEKDLQVTVKALAGFKEKLETAQTDCVQTAADHEASNASRAEELKAIAAARKVLAETTAGAETQAYSLVQINGELGVSSRLHTRADLANVEVVTLVKKLAKEYHSSTLAQLASRISAVVKYGSAAGEDPFVKVKSLITDLITKLEAEGSSEADEKAYCDDQMAKTEEKKGELEFDNAKLTSKIDVASSRSAALKEGVKELQAGLATLAKEQAEMNKMRTSAHANYIQAKSDLEAGLQGVRQALSVLREYYGGSGDSMIQGSIGDAMSQPAKPEYHTAAGGAGSGIIGMLEVVESDFASGLAAEETAESDAQTQYDKVSQENAITKTTMDQDVKYNTKEFKGLDKEVTELVSDRETASTELQAVLEYYSKIKERCIAKPETYEERKRRREAELSGLKEALDILESETAFTQRSRRAGARGIFLGLSK